MDGWMDGEKGGKEAAEHEFCLRSPPPPVSVASGSTVSPLDASSTVAPPLTVGSTCCTYTGFTPGWDKPETKTGGGGFF